MKQLRILGLFLLFLFPLITHAENTYEYRQEFEAFKKSPHFMEAIKKFVVILAKKAPHVDSVIIKNFTELLTAVDFVIINQNTTPKLNHYIESLTVTNRFTSVFIFKKNSTSGELLMEKMFSVKKILIIDEDFLLNKTDNEIEIFIGNQFELFDQMESYLKTNYEVFKSFTPKD